MFYYNYKRNIMEWDDGGDWSDEVEDDGNYEKNDDDNFAEAILEKNYDYVLEHREKLCRLEKSQRAQLARLFDCDVTTKICTDIEDANRCLDQSTKTILFTSYFLTSEISKICRFFQEITIRSIVLELWFSLFIVPWSEFICRMAF